MTQRVKEVWSNVIQNAEIAASDRIIYGNQQSDKENRSKYGSMNTLVLANRSVYPIQVKLDDKTYTDLNGTTTLIISVEDGMYFDMIEIINLDPSNAISAEKITARYGRSEII